MRLQLAGQILDLYMPKVMGILNVTPDSFSDGGHYMEMDAALKHAEQMVTAGAAIIDVGGESTRPGAQPVSIQEELDRVIPIIEKLSALGVLVSADTSKSEVMKEAAKAGAVMINDVYALRNPGGLRTAAELNIPVCLMHMQGEPKTMQHAPSYQNVVSDVRDFLLERVAMCSEAGISREQILLDPGFGFGKTLKHNFLLLKHLEVFTAMGFPIVVGLSRKSMIAQITGENISTIVQQRLPGSLSAAVIAAIKGAGIIRTHDVKETVEALKVFDAVYRS